MEVRERGGHFDPQALDVLGREQADRVDPQRGTGRFVDSGGVQGRHARERRDDRNRHQRDDQLHDQQQLHERDRQNRGVVGRALADAQTDAVQPGERRDDEAPLFLNDKADAYETNLTKADF